MTKEFPFSEKDKALEILEMLVNEEFKAYASTTKKHLYCIKVDESRAKFLEDLGFKALTTKKKKVN